MSHKHFNIKDRESILKSIVQGKNQTQIAELLGKNKSSISREIKRNSINGEYSPFDAQTLYNQRKIKCGAKHKLKDSLLLIGIQEKLEQGWTPEQIAGRSKLNGEFNISFKTIYNAIKLDFLAPNTVNLLPRKGKKKLKGETEKRGKIPNKKMIEARLVTLKVILS